MSASLDVVYLAGELALAPTAVASTQDGFDPAAALGTLTTPLPFEVEYQSTRRTAWQLLNGTVTFTFPAAPLQAPAALEQFPAFVFLFVEDVQEPEGKIDPAGVFPGKRVVYPYNFDAQRSGVRSKVVVLELPTHGPSSVEVEIGGVRVAGVRATYIADTPLA